MNPENNKLSDKTLLNDTFAVIHSRKSVRNFTGENVTKEQIETILKAGMAAPSAVNMQPWAFIAVTERETLDILADYLPFAKMLYKAGAAIIVCAIPEKAHEKLTEYSILDTAAATQNILLAVEALGLGAVWTAVYPKPDLVKFVRETLGIPHNVIPLNVIPIGHPTGEDLPKNKFKKENIKWEKWD